MDSTWYLVLLSLLDDILKWWRGHQFSAPAIKVAFSAKPLKLLGGSSPMNPLLGTVLLSAPASGLAITKRTVTVKVSTADAVSFDYLAGPVTFNCNDGDDVIVTAQDQTAGGLTSDVATVTVKASDNTTKPVTPSISVSFSPAPAPVVPQPGPGPAPSPNAG